MPFKRILTAVDFSPDSLEAFRLAVEMASVHSVSLHLLHVIEAWPAVSGEVAVEFVQKANMAVEQLVASSQPALEKVTLTTEVATGRAFDEIVNRERGWRADLIVLGTKGTTFARGNLFRRHCRTRHQGISLFGVNCATGG